MTDPKTVTEEPTLEEYPPEDKICLVDDPTQFCFAVTPEKFEVPRTGCLEITINPATLDTQMKFIVATLDSVLFVIDGAQGYNGSESQIYYLTSKIEKPKIIRVKMRNLEDLEPIINEGFRLTTEGSMTIYHFESINSPIWISKKTKMARFVLRDAQGWGKEDYTMSLKDTTKELTALQEEIKERWWNMKKRKKRKMSEKFDEEEEWKYQEEYDRKIMELNEDGEKSKKEKKEKERVEQQKMIEKRAAEREKDRILNAQLKTAREGHRLESETDTSKIVKLVTTNSARQRILNKKREPKPRIGPRTKVEKKKKNPCCLIL
ncbi:hypothetical protein CAEBREN_21867 [Caenorhabditis brenneri]|uniref:Uncharacterized protein n=1 Tax=Caenorhabditis brenneri TaxID=135651 RepID=G0N675_CAEBE|nr:hypothetical protein CAEBREN_21867 [Caenorhabditis brenneri]